MKRITYLLLLLLAALPSLAEGGKSQIPLADPYILLDNGKYYAYGTHDASGIRCYSSDDLRTWKDEGQALNKANTTEQQWFWAPEVYHVGDKYIMYFSANEHLFAATATSPIGPFKQVGGYQMEKLIGSEKCIDSHTFFDEDGKAYVFFVRFTDGNCIWQAQLEDDYITPKVGTMHKCFAVSQSWESKMGRVNEGPNVLKVGKRYFLTYSGNDYQSQDYGVGYASTSNIASGTWTKYANNPILQRWDDLVGTGHHSLFYDKEGILRIVFHAHNSTEKIHDRLMYIGTMVATSSRLYMSNEPVIRPTLSTTAPYSPELVTKNWGFEYGGAVTTDLNNDGYMDFVTGGATNDVQNSATDTETSKRQTTVNLFTPSTRKWTKMATKAPFNVAVSPSLLTCDINNDGNMDIIAFEQVGEDTSHEAYTDEYGHEGIFLGKGNGTFSEPALRFTRPDGTACPFDIKGPSSAEILDIDNDGRLDIVCVGRQGGTSYNVILHNMGSDTEGSMHFCVEPYEEEYLTGAIIQAADMNNDGFQDFVISATRKVEGGEEGFTDVYLNDTLQHGRFLRQHLGEKTSTIRRKHNGALQLADFNNDGWMDIYLSGLGDPTSGESATRQHIYINQKKLLPTFANSTSDITTDNYAANTAQSSQPTTQGAAGVIDWNGDGICDLFVGGLKGTAKISSGLLYLGDGKGRMKRSIAIPGATGATICFPDWNGDGRKDFLLNGLCTDAAYLTDEQKGRNAILCYNLYDTPSRPSAPTDCQAEVEADGNVRLTWQAAEDAQPGFTYEIYIKDEQGNLMNATPSIIGGTGDGIRKANLKGRIGGCLSWTFCAPADGTFTWGVQTVDAAYNGSTFTTGPSFTVKLDEDRMTQPKASTQPSAHYDLLGRKVKPDAKSIIISDRRKIIPQFGIRKVFALR